LRKTTQSLNQYKWYSGRDSNRVPQNKKSVALQLKPNASVGTVINYGSVGFEVFTSVVMKSIIFWDVTP
jgi:hypothetical protein